MKSLQITRLTYRYLGSGSKAIEHVSFAWQAGELIVLAGPSGSGKSTLGKLLKGLNLPDLGTVELTEDGSSKVLASRELLDLIGWTDAQPERQIFAATVAEEVGFALTNRGVKGDQWRESVMSALQKVSLDPEAFWGRDPLTLSGGEKRRIALASTIVMSTSFLILDEPEGGLDEPGIEMTVRLVGKLKDDGVGILVISHDPASVWREADRILALEGGILAGNFPTGNFDWDQLTHWLETGEGKPQ